MFRLNLFLPASSSSVSSTNRLGCASFTFWDKPKLKVVSSIFYFSRQNHFILISMKTSFVHITCFHADATDHLMSLLT